MRASFFPSQGISVLRFLPVWSHLSSALISLSIALLIVFICLILFLADSTQWSFKTIHWRWMINIHCRRISFTQIVLLSRWLFSLFVYASIWLFAKSTCIEIERERTLEEKEEEDKVHWFVLMCSLAHLQSFSSSFLRSFTMYIEQNKSLVLLRWILVVTIQ